MSNQTFTSKTYFQKRVHSFGMTMIVMGACFFCYYLGLFGGVEGPLNPGTIGAWLFGLGVTWWQVKLAFLIFLVLSLGWNLALNLAFFLTGRRRTCTHNGIGKKVCGLPARKVTQETRGQGRYQCPKGHCRADAGFSPVKKGYAAHTVWITVLLFNIIIWLCR